MLTRQQDWLPVQVHLEERPEWRGRWEHADDLLHFNDIHSWRMFKAKALIFKELLRDPFVSPQTIMDRVYASPESEVDQINVTSGSDKHPTAHRLRGSGNLFHSTETSCVQQAPRAEETNKTTTVNKSQLKTSAVASLQ